MTQAKLTQAKLTQPNLAPNIAKTSTLKIVGLRRHHNFGNGMFAGLASQWREFAPMIAGLANRKGRASFGLCFDMAGNKKSFDYLTGVEVTTLDGVKEPLAGVTLQPSTYAVFPHTGHVSKLNETVDAAWKWLPTSGHRLDQGAALPTFIEHYGARFNPETGYGDIEVWFPVRV